MLTSLSMSSKGKIGQKLKNENVANHSAVSLVENKNLLIDSKDKPGNVSRDDVKHHEKNTITVN